MLIHNIVDYSFLYYKYKFQLESGKMRRLTSAINWNGAVIEKDISQIYYSIKEIEGFRRRLEQVGHQVVTSICFDMPPARKDENYDENLGDTAAKKYKSNRTKKLNDEDFENIRFVERLLSKAGYNTYRIDGYEADDIIAYLIDEYREAFEFNIIYTPDLDLLVHIQPGVGAQRYKVYSGYTSVDMACFSEYLSKELKCNMPYNGLILYKATVGDKSDCIDGIKKFGPKAFDKLVEHLSVNGVDWSKMGNWRQVDSILEQLGESGYLTPEQTHQARESLSLVRPMSFEGVQIAEPTKCSNRSMREAAYMEYNMKSLVD